MSVAEGGMGGGQFDHITLEREKTLMKTKRYYPRPQEQKNSQKKK